MRAPAWSPAGSDGRYAYEAAVVMVLWPESQHRALMARWPHLAGDVGATWEEHRRRVERHCVFAERDTGMAVNQVAAELRGFEAWLARRGVQRPTGDDLRDYHPDVRHAAEGLVAWPPDRVGPCWCGSGRKYKRCCRPYGLGTLGPD